MDAQIKFKREECASNMEQHGQRKDAAVKDAQIKSSLEEYVWSMEQRSSYAMLVDALINPNEEDCAWSMEQRSGYAAVKDAQIKLGREECVLGMGHTVTQTMNLQLLHHALGQNLTKLLWHILISVIQILVKPRQLTYGGGSPLWSGCRK